MLSQCCTGKNSFGGTAAPRRPFGPSVHNGFRANLKTKSEPGAAGPILRGRRSLRICSFRGAYGNRGSGMEQAPSDAVTGFEPAVRRGRRAARRLDLIALRANGRWFESGFKCKRDRPHKRSVPFGPSDWIRTSGLLNPIQARYQTSPHPDFCSAFVY